MVQDIIKQCFEVLKPGDGGASQQVPASQGKTQADPDNVRGNLMGLLLGSLGGISDEPILMDYVKIVGDELEFLAYTQLEQVRVFNWFAKRTHDRPGKAPEPLCCKQGDASHIA